MSEEVKQEQAEQAQATQDQANQQDQETTKTDEVSEREKKLRSEINGLNRKIDEMNKKFKEAELEKMSKEEQAEARRKEALEEAERYKREASQFRRQMEIEKAVHKYKLPERFADRIKGETAEEIEADAKGIADFFSQEIQRQASEAVNQKLSGKPPKGGESVDTSSLQAQYDEAVKRNDVPAQLAISRKAQELGEKLKQF